MFAIYTEEREIISLGSDTRVYLDTEAEASRVNVFAGRWLIAHFAVTGEAGQPLSGFALAHELLDALFAAILEGKHGFDITAFLSAQTP